MTFLGAEARVRGGATAVPPGSSAARPSWPVPPRRDARAGVPILHSIPGCFAAATPSAAGITPARPDQPRHPRFSAPRASCRPLMRVAFARGLKRHSRRSASSPSAPHGRGLNATLHAGARHSEGAPGTIAAASCTRPLMGGGRNCPNRLARPGGAQLHGIHPQISRISRIEVQS